jgi:hypothetical protein
MLAEKAGHEMDEWCSPPASHPEQHNAGLHSPAPSTQSSEEEQLEMDSGEASVQRESKVVKSKWRWTSSSAIETSPAQEGSSKSHETTHKDSQRKQKLQ